MSYKISKDNSHILSKSSITLKIIKIPEFSGLMALVLLFLIFTFVNRFFISWSNINIILTSASYSGIIVIGMCLVMISGQFDLSAGGVTGFSAIMSAIFMVNLSLPVWLSIIIALIISMILGLINGLLTVKLKIPAIVSTLAMMFILLGAVTVVTQGGRSIFPLPESINNFSRIKLLGALPWSFFIFVILAVIFDFMLRKTVLGRKIYAVGANVNVAKTMGINTDLMRISMYVLLSFLCGLSGILFMISIRTGSPNIGDGWILMIVAATVIGGTSIFGGRGTIWGAILGNFVVWVMRSGLTMIGSRAEWQNVLIGIILISVPIYDYIKQKLKLSD